MYLKLEDVGLNFCVRILYENMETKVGTKLKLEDLDFLLLRLGNYLPIQNNYPFFLRLTLHQPIHF